MPPNPELEHEGQTNKTGQSTILLMRKCSLDSLYMNEPYISVNMFKALKLGPNTF